MGSSRSISQVAANRRGVALAAHGDRNGIARRRAGDASTEGLVNRRFGVIDQVIPGKVLTITCGSTVSTSRFASADAVTHAVGAADADGVKRVFA